MRKSVLGAAALSLVLLAGCQPAPPNLPPLVHIAPSECTGAPDTGRASTLPFDAEGKEKPLAFTIDMSSGCLTDGDAKSLYRIFALPEPGYSYMLTVRSLPSTNGILAPRVMMLDGDGQVLRMVGSDTFLFRGRALVTMLRVQDGERFIAVASDPGVVGQDISRLSGTVSQQTISTGVVMFTAYTGSESTAKLTYAHNGNMEIAARPIPPSK